MLENMQSKESWGLRVGSWEPRVKGGWRNCSLRGRQKGCMAKPGGREFQGGQTHNCLRET